MRVVVTGVAGLIGSWVAEKLCSDARVTKVIGIDDLSGGDIANVHVIRSPKFTFEHVNLMRSDVIAELFAANRPEIIVHAAACAREGASAFQPQYIVQSNAMMSMVVIENGIRYGMKKLVFFSSMAVAGDQKAPFDEEMPRKPVDVYGVSKAATEASIEMLASVHGFTYAIIRPHNVFGPRQMLSDPYRNVFGIWMNRIMRHEPCYIFGEGHIRAFSYIEDSLVAFNSAILGEKVDNAIVYIGGKDPITIDEAYEEVLKNFAEYKKPELIRLPARPLEVKEAWCSVEKSSKWLGYKENVGWKKGVAKMAEWAKKKGSQAWRTDFLPLENERMPRPWAELNTRR